jgi:hypothetical protein
MKLLQNKKLLIFFLLVTYIIIPFIDSVACDYCIAPFQGRGVGIKYSSLSQADTSSINDTDTYGDKSSPQKGTKDFCSICFNASKMLTSHDIKTVFSSVSLTFQPAFLTLLEIAFPINKPPQN